MRVSVCVSRLEFERQQREELEKLELKRYESLKQTHLYTLFKKHIEKCDSCKTSKAFDVKCLQGLL